MVCRNCGKKNNDELLKCEQCGEGIALVAKPPSRAAIQSRTPHKKLIIREPPKRKTSYVIILGRQARFGGGDFDIIVNGGAYGKLKAGKTITISVSEPEIEILIKAMGLNHVKMRLKLGDENAYAEAAIWKKNILLHSISGADIT
jgi:hypothetical protein